MIPRGVAVAGRPDEGAAVPWSAVDSYQREREQLFAVAYRMLGSALDAEDVLQEAYLRWHRVDHAEIRRPAAFLGRMVRRLALNVLGSADRRRVEYGGVLPPEEVHPLDEPDPLAAREATERLSDGIRLLLERLSPMERAVFVLRECFGFSYAEISLLTARSLDNCRQIDSRARRRLRGPGAARPVSTRQHRELVARFLRAARDGEVDDLVSLLVTEALEHRPPRALPERPGAPAGSATSAA